VYQVRSDDQKAKIHLPEVQGAKDEMTNPRIEVRSIEDLTPDINNVNRHTQRGHGIVENSIRRRGVGRGILAGGKNTDKPGIIAGNLTHEKARDAGIDEVIFVHTTGNQLVVTVRDDLDPASAEAVALGIEDNESGKLSYNPDIDLLATLAAGDNALLSALRKDDKIFSGMVEGMQPLEFNEEVLDGFGALVERELSSDSSVTLVFPKEDAERVRQQIKIDSAPIFARRVLSLVGG
jgi:hypothetical protein